MVLDFTHIKRKIQDKFDHKVINEVVPFNPTAENLAKYICDELAPFCYRVDVQESQNNIASYIKDDVKIKQSFQYIHKAFLHRTVNKPYRSTNSVGYSLQGV